MRNRLPANGAWYTRRVVDEILPCGRSALQLRDITLNCLKSTPSSTGRPFLEPRSGNCEGPLFHRRRQGPARCRLSLKTYRGAMVGWIIFTTDNLRWTSKHAAYLGQLLSVEIQASARVFERSRRTKL